MNHFDVFTRLKNNSLVFSRFSSIIF